MLPRNVFIRKTAILPLRCVFKLRRSLQGKIFLASLVKLRSSLQPPLRSRMPVFKINYLAAPHFSMPSLFTISLFCYFPNFFLSSASTNGGTMREMSPPNKASSLMLLDFTTPHFSLDGKNIVSICGFKFWFIWASSNS